MTEDLYSKPYIFFSYAHSDKSQVIPIISEIHQKGYNIWYDRGLEPASDWSETLGRRIRCSAMVIVFISPNATDSKYVKKEINYSIILDRPTLPIYLEPTKLSDGMAFQINNIQAIHQYCISAERFNSQLEKVISKYISSPSNKNDRQKKDQNDRQNKKSSILLKDIQYIEKLAEISEIARNITLSLLSEALVLPQPFLIAKIIKWSKKLQLRIDKDEIIIAQDTHLIIEDFLRDWEESEKLLDAAHDDINKKDWKQAIQKYQKVAEIYENNGWLRELIQIRKRMQLCQQKIEINEMEQNHLASMKANKNQYFRLDKKPWWHAVNYYFLYTLDLYHTLLNFYLIFYSILIFLGEFELIDSTFYSNEIRDLYLHSLFQNERSIPLILHIISFPVLTVCIFMLSIIFKDYARVKSGWFFKFPSHFYLFNQDLTKVKKYTLWGIPFLPKGVVVSTGIILPKHQKQCEQLIAIWALLLVGLLFGYLLIGWLLLPLGLYQLNYALIWNIFLVSFFGFGIVLHPIMNYNDESYYKKIPGYYYIIACFFFGELVSGIIIFFNFFPNEFWIIHFITGCIIVIEWGKNLKKQIKTYAKIVPKFLLRINK